MTPPHATCHRQLADQAADCAGRASRHAVRRLLVRTAVRAIALALALVVARSPLWAGDVPGPATSQPPARPLALDAFARAVLAEQAGDLEGAQAGFEQARTADPDNLGLLRRAASIHLRRADLHGASSLWRSAAESHPERLGFQLGYADFLLQSSPGDATAQALATRTLEAALRRWPGEPAVFSRLFRLYENAAMRDRSLSMFQGLLANPQQSAEFWAALLPMARTLLPGDSEESRQTLDTIHRSILQLDPLNSQAAREASDYFRQSRRLNEAIAVLRDHTTACPASLDMRIRLGILLLANQQAEEGMAALRAVVAIDPDLPLAHQSLAKACDQVGDAATARHHRAELIRIRGAGPREYLTLAEEYLAANEPRLARLLLEKASYEYPTDPFLAARLAIATSSDPQTSSTAAPLFQKAEGLAATAKSPTAIDPAFRQAYSQVLASSPEAAEAQLRAAIRSIPPDQPKQLATALRQLANLWQQANKNQAAAADLLQRAAQLEAKEKP